MRLPRTLLRPAAGELAVDRAEVMRLLGYKENRTRVDERHLALVDAGIRLAREAARPAVTYAYCAVTVAGETVATAVPGLTWRSKSLARLLKEAVGIYLVAATLGPGVDEAIQRLFASEEYALATIVDAAGSTLIHSLSQLVQGQLPGAGTPLYGPGYGDWPIACQRDLALAAGAEAIDLTCTETCYLIPQKSLVGIIGVTAPESGRKLQASGCSLCSMPDCAYRVRPARGGAH
jgi:hypothetical protein